MKSWFENSQELNSFELLKWTEAIKWSNALVVETSDSIIIEVPIKLKERYKVLNMKDPGINVEHRLLFVKSKNTVTPYIEYISSKKDLGYLQDTEKVNYWKKTEDFEGAIVLQNSKNEGEIIYQWETVDDCEQVSLKSAILDGGKCYGLYEHFSDGSSELIAILYCTGGGTSSGGGSSDGNYTPTIPCNCEDFCPVCHKCLQMLKNAIADPEGGGGSTTETVVCEMCGGHPVPAIELSLKFENNEKVMCIYSNLISTATRFNPLVTSFLANFSDGVSIDPGDIKFDLGTLDGAYGNCTTNGDCFTVVLNENEIQNRAPIEIAKTLIHEILHAQIGHQLQISLGSFLANFGQYQATVNNKTYIDQHLLMIENYVDPMIRFLKEYDSLNGFSADEKYYKAMALSGLKGLCDLSQSELDEIFQAQNYFRNRGLNCQ